MKYPVSLLAALLITPLAQAQSEPQWYITPFGGYSFAATNFDANKTGLATQASVSADDAAHYGVMVGVRTIDPGNIYLVYSNQATDLVAGDVFSGERVTSLDISYLHLGGSLYFPRGNFVPYITATAGLTLLRPGDYYSSETRFSMGFGGGAEYRFTPRVALVGDLRAYATFIDSNNDLLCDRDDCVWQIDADVMWQGQANLGLNIRF